jgi:hypothetical protein
VPILRNARHEKFAQELAANGVSAYQAYINAGFRPSRQNAARLRAKEDIAARVLEIQAAGAKSAEISVASLLAELEEARSKATSLNQLSAAVRATAEKAKISGLLVEKQQIEVVNTEYEPQCAQEVLHRVAERVSVEAAVTLGRCFGVEFDPTWSPDSEPIRASGYSQRMIEERRPIVNGRKREIS